MFKTFFVLSSLVLTSQANNDQDSSDDGFMAINPLDMSVDHIDEHLCVSSKFTIKPFVTRKFLGLDRILDNNCDHQWFFEDHGKGPVGEQNFSLYTMGSKHDIFLSTLPDRLSVGKEESPEVFTLTTQNFDRKLFNIISKYADVEFNGFSLLCHTNSNTDSKLIYKANTRTNQKLDGCQWQFSKFNPTTTTDSPTTTTDLPTTTTDLPTTTTDLPTTTTNSPVSTTDSPTTSATCFTEDNNPCDQFIGKPEADYAYFPSCTSCCHFIQCDASGNGYDRMCAQGAWWDPNEENTPTNNGCVRNDNGQCAITSFTFHKGCRAFNLNNVLNN